MSTPSAPRYSLTFVNNSSSAWSVCIYQTDPDIDIPNVQSLAWLVQDAAPQTTVTFAWTIDYAFTLSGSAPLTPGVVHVPSRHLPADLETANAVTVTRQASYTFKDQRRGPNTGSLYITEDSTVGLQQASVGIAMSGAGVFAVEAEPNLNLVFSPHPVYWITAGQYQPGQVIDSGATVNSAQIDFPPGVYSMTATLNADNTWTVSAG